MIVVMRPVQSVRPYPGNPRLNDDAVDAVARSLLEFGFRQPIVVDADGVIVVGHTRYKAALRLGLTDVPVHVATDPLSCVVLGTGRVLEGLDSNAMLRKVLKR